MQWTASSDPELHSFDLFGAEVDAVVQARDSMRAGWQAVVKWRSALSRLK